MFARLSPEGVVIALASGQEADMIEVPEGVDALGAMLAGQVWQARPRLQAPLVSGASLHFGGLIPEGTSLEVVDVLDRVVLYDGPLEAVIELAEPGEYQIEARPPSPWIGWSGRMVVA